METASCSKSLKCSKLTDQVKEDDPFMRLPDDIIISHLLSRLSLKEAIRSSVLSRRWQKLWTLDIGTSLIFTYLQDPYEVLHRVSGEDVRRLMHQLAHGVTRILTNYPKPTLDELAVRFEFNSSCSAAIDSWVECALTKGVNRLELDFSQWADDSVQKPCYIFPAIQKLSTLHAQCGNRLHMPVNCAGMSNLKVVSLKRVGVPSEIIEFMLSNCPLERLCVWGSLLRAHIKVTDRSVNLKSIELVKCVYTKLHVTSSSLLSLHYSGIFCSLSLEYVPLLSELTIGGNCCKMFLIRGCDSGYFSYLSQLKRLTLKLTHRTLGYWIAHPKEFPKFVKLEQLEVNMKYAYRDSCLLPPIALIKAAPFLRRFSITLCTLRKTKPRMRPREDDRVRDLQHAITMLKHQRLKLIEIKKFRGYPTELDLAHRLLGIPQSLEKFIVTVDRMPSDSVYKHTTISHKFSRNIGIPEPGECRMLAEGLGCSVPAGAEFVIL